MPRRRCSHAFANLWKDQATETAAHELTRIAEATARNPRPLKRLALRTAHQAADRYTQPLPPHQLQHLTADRTKRVTTDEAHFVEHRDDLLAIAEVKRQPLDPGEATGVPHEGPGNGVPGSCRLSYQFPAEETAGPNDEQGHGPTHYAEEDRLAGGRRSVEGGELALPAADMAVYDLTHLSYAEQLRWRTQRCPAHAAAPQAADLALADWEVFDPLLHHQHIHARLPVPVKHRRQERA